MNVAPDGSGATPNGGVWPGLTGANRDARAAVQWHHGAEMRAPALRIEIKETIMRAIATLALLPVLALGACEVTSNPQNNSSTVTLSGDAAKNGTASALEGASQAIGGAANKINEVSNNASDVHTGLSNLTASASRLGQSVDHAADSLGNAVDGKHRVAETTDKTTTTTTTEKK